MQKHAVEQSFERWFSRALHIPSYFFPRARKLEKKLVVKKTGKRVQKTFDRFVFWTMTWPFYVIACLLISPLYIFKRVTVQNEDRLPLGEDTVILFASHPGLAETAFLKRLAFKNTMLHPYRRMAWSTPDPTLFKKWWFLRLFKPFLIQRFIFVDRSSNIKKVRALFEIVRTLRAGAWLNLHPEGGRTGSAKEGEVLLESRKGHKIRQFDDGLASIALRTGAYLVPVGVIGTDDFWPRDKIFPRFHRRCTIKIGEPICFDRITGNKKQIKAKLKEQVPELTKLLEEILLDTLDE